MTSICWAEVLVRIFIPALQISREQVPTAQLSQASSQCWDGKRAVPMAHALPLPQQAPQKITPLTSSLPRQTSQESTTGVNVHNSFCRILLCSASTQLSIWRCVSEDIIKIQFCGICMLLDTYTGNTEKRHLIWLFTDCIQLKSLEQNVVFICYLKKIAGFDLSHFKRSLLF